MTKTHSKEEVIVMTKKVTKKGFRPVDVFVTITDGRAVGVCPHNPLIIKDIYKAEKNIGEEVELIDNPDKTKISVIQYYKGKSKEEIKDIIKWEGVKFKNE